MAFIKKKSHSEFVHISTALWKRTNHSFWSPPPKKKPGNHNFVSVNLVVFNVSMNVFWLKLKPNWDHIVLSSLIIFLLSSWLCFHSFIHNLLKEFSMCIEITCIPIIVFFLSICVYCIYSLLSLGYRSILISFSFRILYSFQEIFHYIPKTLHS